ncbi:MAG: hypothetical protein NTX86_03935 [Candidatus Dependentiae bacterium]|nr:hypothetical protein [Candidatus Dependentiae bacterium]
MMNKKIIGFTLLATLTCGLLNTNLKADRTVGEWAEDTAHSAGQALENAAEDVSNFASDTASKLRGDDYYSRSERKSTDGGVTKTTKKTERVNKGKKYKTKKVKKSGRDGYTKTTTKEETVQ